MDTRKGTGRELSDGGTMVVGLLEASEVFGRVELGGWLLVGLLIEVLEVFGEEVVTGLVRGTTEGLQEGKSSVKATREGIMGAGEVGQEVEDGEGK